MHEFFIAEQLLDQIVATAADHGVIRVRSVELEVGAMELVVPEALRTAFAAAGTGTVAQSAELIIRTLPARAVCEACGNGYVTEIADYTCPQCGAAAAKMASGSGIVLCALDCLAEGDEEDG